MEELESFPIFFNDKYSKYPTMTANISSMHQIPTKLLLFASEGSLTREQYYHDYDLYEMDALYGDVLCRCNGNYTIRQIVDQCRQLGRDEHTVLSIIENAMFKGWIELGDSPRPVTIPKTGDAESFFPRHLSVEMTNVCNLKCKHCYRDASFIGKFISRDQLLKWMDILVDKGLMITEFTGGEPLLHPKFYDIISHANDRLEQLALLTNGTLVDEKVVERLKPFADKMLVSISIDSSTSDFHDQFRGQRGAWEKSTRAISLFAKSGFYTRVAMSVAPGNMDDIENVLLLAQDLGAVSFSFGFVMPFGRGAELSWNQVTREQLINYMKLERKIKKYYPKFVPTLPERTTKRILCGETNCGGGWRTGVLSPTGRYRPCLNVSEGFCNIGNLFEEGLAIFKNPVIKVLSDTRVPRFETCNGCSSMDFCSTCWYRGLIGSMGNEGCKWDCQQLKSYVSMENLKNIQQDCCIVSKMSLFS